MTAEEELEQWRKKYQIWLENQIETDKLKWLGDTAFQKGFYSELKKKFKSYCWWC